MANKENFENKKRRILTGIAATEIVNDLGKLFKFLENPGTVGAVDIKRAQALSGILAGKDPNDPAAKDRRLFSYKNKFHLVTDTFYRELPKDAVAKHLTDFPDTDCYYICTSEKMCALPEELSGKKATAIMVADDQGVIDYIKQVTGVELTLKDL